MNIDILNAYCSPCYMYINFSKVIVLLGLHMVEGCETMLIKLLTVIGVPPEFHFSFKAYIMLLVDGQLETII
jgi:hypothetical protein